MVEWGKSTCETPGSVDELIKDYYPHRDAASIRKYEAATALQDWIQYNQSDESSPNGSTNLSDAVYAGCLQATRGWG